MGENTPKQIWALHSKNVTQALKNHSTAKRACLGRSSVGQQ